MKKIILILLAFISLKVSAQTYQNPNPGLYGIRYNRIAADSAFSIPTWNGTPTLHSNRTKQAAIAQDSTAGITYVYNPKTLAWSALALTSGTVASVTGTTNRITITGTSTNPIINISTAYIGQTSITILGTIGTGTWQGSTIADAYISSSGNWNTAFSQTRQWDGGSTGLVAGTGRTSLGGTTVGQNFFTLTNPSAITFPRINADNSVSALDAATFRTAIGAGTGSGTVTAVSIATANGFSGSSSGGSTPALTIVAGAITPTSVNSVVLSGSSTPTLAVTGTSSISGSNTGDQTITLSGVVTGSGTSGITTAFAIDRMKSLNPTAVKTTTYSAVANDFVPCDNTSGSFTITLPNAPADKTVFGAKMVIQGSTNTITINTSGSDVFNKAGGSTSGALTYLNQCYIFQYQSSTGIWYLIADDLPKAALDAIYVPQTRTVNGKALSSNITLGLASSDFANQGTTTTVVHGNVSGNPSFAAVSLTADVTGTLPVANGGTGITSFGTGVATALGVNTGSAGAFLLNNGSGTSLTGVMLLASANSATTPGAASTPSQNYTGAVFTGGTGTTTVPFMYLNNGGSSVSTWSTAGTYQGFNTASGYTGNFLDGHVNGGASVFSVNYQGNGVFAGTLGVTGTTTVGTVNYTTLTGGGSSSITTLNTSAGSITTTAVLRNGGQAVGTGVGIGFNAGAAGTNSGLIEYVQTGATTTRDGDFVFRQSVSNALADVFRFASTGTITSNAIVMTPPAASGTLATLAGTEAFSNKTTISATGAFSISSVFGTTPVPFKINDDSGLGFYNSGENQLNFNFNSNATSTGFINYSGYQGGATQFRNTSIGDGKNNVIASFTGSTGAVNIANLTASQLVQTDGSKNLVSSNTLPSGTAGTNMALTTPSLGVFTATSGTIGTGTVRNTPSAFGTSFNNSSASGDITSASIDVTQTAATTGTIFGSASSAGATNTSGTVDTEVAHRGLYYQSGTGGTVSNASLFRSEAFISNGTTTNYIGFLAAPPTLSGTGAITNRFSFFAETNAGVAYIKDGIRTEGTIRLKGYTVATLPSGGQGDTAYVTDALTPGFGVIIVGGGGTTIPVFYNGSNWIAY